jgi:hypothetical protein
MKTRFIYNSYLFSFVYLLENLGQIKNALFVFVLALQFQCFQIKGKKKLKLQRSGTNV